MSADTSKSDFATPSILSHADHMAARSHDVLLLLGRVLLGWIFVTSGWRKLMDIPGFAATMPRRGLPEFLGYVAPPVEFIGGLMILFGVATRYAALLICCSLSLRRSARTAIGISPTQRNDSTRTVTSGRTSR